VVGCWRGYLSGARCRLAYHWQLMPLPLTVSCFSKIQIGFTFLVTAHPGSPGQRAVKRVCVCVVVVVGVVVVVVVDSTARGVVRRSAAERPVLRRRHDRSHQRKLRTPRHRHLLARQRAYWRHPANTIERSARGCDAALSLARTADDETPSLACQTGTSAPTGEYD